MKETDVAAVGAEWLESRGLEVYQEVEGGRGRIDLVGRRQGLDVAVECKLGFGLDVIAQADAARRVAHEAWCCVYAGPRHSWSEGRRVGLELCRDRGIGVLEVYHDRSHLPPAPLAIRVARDPRVGLVEARPTGLKISKLRLHEAQKDSAPAGTNGGGYSTRWSRAITALREHVQTAGPDGVVLGEAERAITHEYRRATFVAMMGRAIAGSGGTRDARVRGFTIEGWGVKARVRFDGDVF